ncbi:MAG: hypothetical protein ACOX2F_10365 [bacterium]
MSSKIALLLLIFFSLSLTTLHASLLFDDGVPETLKNEISELYQKKNIKENFLIEIKEEGDLLIIAENGHTKSLPASSVTAFDVINVMEEMVKVIFAKKEEGEIAEETRKDMDKVEDFTIDEEKKPPKKDKLIKKGIKVAERVEFFPWVENKRRFNVSILAASEENWAGGAGVSVAAAFLKFGFNFKKGANIVFSKKDKVSWESYGLNVQLDILSAYGAFLAVGFEIALYRAKEKLFEREFFIFKTGYRYKWFETSASVNVSPSTVELGLFGKKYLMDRYYFLISAGVSF